MSEQLESGGTGGSAVREQRNAWEAIVIGAGLNGLTCAAYLARRGLRVLVLERTERIGGTAVTGEFAPGFRADLCRHDVGHIPSRLVRKLALERHGLKLVSSSPAILAPGPDGSTLTLGGGRPGEPSDSLKRISSADAAKWPEFSRRIAKLAGFLRHLYAGPVPSAHASSLGDVLTLARLAVKLRGLGRTDMVEFLRIAPMSVAELLDDWFESPVLKGVLASRGVVHLCQGPRAAGTAFNLLHHQVGRLPGSFRSSIRPLGGVGALARAIADSARAAGVELRTGAPVARITMRGGRASGVVLASGEEIAARRVVSGTSPRHTFLELCDPAQLEPEFVRAVRNIRYRGVWAKVHLAVDRLPAFRVKVRDDTRPPRSIVIAPSVDYLERAYDDAKYGRVSERPYLDVFVPTATDRDLAPEEKHVLSVQVQYAPYHLRAPGQPRTSAVRSGAATNRWDAARRGALGDRVVQTLAEYAPELPGAILHRHVFTPLDLEEEFGIPEGHAYHGELSLDQALFMRPVPQCSRYATPVRGLYLCGSGAHPGGGIAGQAGANAAREILAAHQRDLRG